MTFRGPNDPGISDPRDRANLQPSDWADRAPAPYMKRDKGMDWQPDLVNDATEWLQRAGMGDEAAIKEVCLSVAPALLQEVKKLRALSERS
jgi:hypothetical protein